ncbi:MAG: response regulator [Planctomycetota bacterium]|nr:MAG: response regulator [Planctomycetota bacterium]
MVGTETTGTSDRYAQRRAFRVLVVDDSATSRASVADALRTAGYQVETAADGEQALRTCAAVEPHLIVLDVVLPKMNGYQVCRRLKKLGGGRDVRVVMLSSKSQAADRYWGLKQGADGYLAKPWQPEELVACVDRFLLGQGAGSNGAC